MTEFFENCTIPRGAWFFYQFVPGSYFSLTLLHFTRLPRLSLDCKHIFTEAFCDWLTHLPWKPAPFLPQKHTALSQLLHSSCQCAGPRCTRCREHPSHLGWHRGQYKSSQPSLAAVSVKEATACNFPCVLQLLYSTAESMLGCALLRRMQEKARNTESKEQEASKEMYVGVLDEKTSFGERKEHFYSIRFISTTYVKLFSL